MEHGGRPGPGALAQPGAPLPLPCRIGELVELGARSAPAALGSPAAWRRLRRLEDPLPALFSEAGLECRLEPGGAARVDLEVCLRRQAWERLGEALESDALRSAAGRLPGWRRARAFLEAWVRPQSTLGRSVAVVWLEFDLPEAGGAAEPFTVLTLDPEALYASGRVEPRRLRCVLREGLDRLSDHGLEPATAARLETLLASLPASAQVRHAALRPTPAGEIARLVVSLPWRQLPGLLERAGRGPDPGLAAWLEAHCPPTLTHAVNLDVTPEGLGPRVGVEFHYPSSPAKDLRWQRLFAALEREGACRPDVSAALQAWGAPLEAGLRFGGRLRVERELLLKAVLAPGEPTRAKAYLPFAPRWLADAPRKPGA